MTMKYRTLGKIRRRARLRKQRGMPLNEVNLKRAQELVDAGLVDHEFPNPDEFLATYGG